jgi:glutamate-1-semialdehyde 2,1-aminomutase
MRSSSVINKKKFLYSNGVHIYDNKKKKYLDFSLSNGALVLGHSNKIYKNCVKKIINKGSAFSINNYAKINYEKLIKKKFKNINKVIFSNSGSESNIRALRIARAITKKNKIAIVNGSWHGSVDNFLFDYNNKKEIKELSSGIDSNIKKDLVILPYNDLKKSQIILKNNKNKIAMIMLEPITSSLPLNESEKYVKDLFFYAKKNKILICFDEIITGLRVNGLSVFKKLNLKPDIITFGKCFGGGLPIGLTCLSKETARKIDLLNKPIFFGGTFSGNFLTCSLGVETFNFISKNNKKFLNKLLFFKNRLTNEINSFSQQLGVNFKFVGYESFVRPIFTNENIYNVLGRNNYDKNSLKTYKYINYLLSHNIHVAGRGNIYFSFEHKISDIIKLITVTKKFLIRFKKQL